MLFRSNYGLSLLTIALLTPAAVYVLTCGFNILFNNSWNGPGLGLRVFTALIASICLVTSMPVKCYGKITEKQYGSFWLTLPASRLEKFISMFLMTCIIVPAVGSALYLGIDALICALDSSCGNSIIAWMGEFTTTLTELEVSGSGALLLDRMTSPWLYIDEPFTMTLPFLLGAIWFRNGKTVKTFLALAAISTAMSMLMSPFISDFLDIMLDTVPLERLKYEILWENKVLKNVALLDTISDTVTNIALMAGIWFRIKTLKH